MGGTLRRVDEKASCAEYSKKEKKPLLLTIFLLPVSHYPTDFWVSIKIRCKKKICVGRYKAVKKIEILIF